MKFSPPDQQQLADRGIPAQTVLKQLQHFRDGIAPVKVERPCTADDGIRRLNLEERRHYCERFQVALAQGRITKMVPASGAATRMFESLIAVLERDDLPAVVDLKKQRDRDTQICDTLRFLESIERFPFYPDLVELGQARGVDVAMELAAGEYRELLRDFLTEPGLGYATLPKALLKFHHYDEQAHTALEEHLQEAIKYACDTNGVIRIHLTVSPEHRERMQQLLTGVGEKLLPAGGRLEVTFSNQHARTDTIAVDMENSCLRDSEGRLLFRPGGHGALLENLQELEGDIVFIKNIDNVAHERHLALTVEYKQALGGCLLELQEQVFTWLEELAAGEIAPARLLELFRFLREQLQMEASVDIRNASPGTQTPWLIARLNRPLRVCGMVKNEGEPGGGPFWVKDEFGMETPQLVEMGQVDLEDNAQREQVETSTHFSPVDLVCGVRDFRGNVFDLHQYRDPDSGMISEKSFQGRRIKALELPGLWNGGMAFWNSVFIEVPPLTFNPVKTILDLLRPPHQPQD